MIIAAVVVLAIYSYKDFIDNIYLVISLLLLIGGIFTHILVNKHIEEWQNKSGKQFVSAINRMFFPL